MTFYPTNSSYVSPPRRSRGSRLTQTNTATNNQAYPSDTESPSQTIRIHKTASFRIPRKTSLSLLSRVSKFEALDALSDPFQVPSLRPAHLSVSRNSPSRKSGQSHARKLANMFTPNTKNKEPHIMPTSEEDFAAEQDHDIFARSKKEFPYVKKSTSRKLRKSQPSDESNNVRRRGPFQVPTNTPESKDTSPVAPYVRSPVSVRIKTIRDMIRLYDGTGSIDKTPSRDLPKENIQQTEHTMHTTKQTTARLHKLRRDENASPAAFTSSPRDKAIKKQPTTPFTPTKSYQSFAASKRQQLNGAQTPTTISISKSSPAKSTISNVSPRIKACGKACHHCGAKFEESSLRGNTRRMDVASNRQKSPSPERRAEPAVIVERGRTLVRIAGNARTNEPSPDRRDISNKIGELYRAKSLERNHQTLRRVPSSQDLATAKIETRTEAPPNTQVENERRIPPRVASIRKKFEGGSLPTAPVSIVPKALHLPIFSNVSPFSKDAKVSSEKPCPQPAPVLLPLDNGISNSVSPKTLREPAPIDAKKVTTIILDQALQRPVIAMTRKQATKRSPIISDKVRIFEARIEQNKKPQPEKRKGNYARRIRSSMKSFFEPSSRKSHEEVEVELTNQEVQEILDEFKAQETAARAGQRGSLVGKWNTIQIIPQESGTDGTMSERGGESPCAGGVKEMIVKEVECCLKQPKPVRATEMRRMVLLCRERVGGIIDKERGRIVQARKL